MEDKISLFQKIAATEVASLQSNGLVSKLSELEIDFDSNVEEQLISTFTEVESAEVPPPTDNHMVRLSLRDETVFAFAPRRFAHTERLKIREIMDDLLSIGIIKPSTSPYCARVVPVHKKNGDIRLCVDMRPLNNKVVRQKFPFPVIEDCLARLTNKHVFTLLDLRDGFHQIKVHPDFTKFFAFATPDEM